MGLAEDIRRISEENFLAEAAIAQAFEAVAVSVDQLEARVAALELPAADCGLFDSTETP